MIFPPSSSLGHPLTRRSRPNVAGQRRSCIVAMHRAASLCSYARFRVGRYPEWSRGAWWSVTCTNFFIFFKHFTNRPFYLSGYVFFLDTRCDTSHLDTFGVSHFCTELNVCMSSTPMDRCASLTVSWCHCPPSSTGHLEHPLAWKKMLQCLPSLHVCLAAPPQSIVNHDDRLVASIVFV